MISSIALPTRLAATGAQGSRASSAAEKTLNVAGELASTVGYFDTLYSAIGRGAASTPFAVVGVAGEAFSAYGSIRGLSSQFTAQQVNDLLKSQNNGHDLNADDANHLAADMTHRLHQASAVSLISHLALGAAIATGNMPLALGALVGGMGSTGFAGYTAVQDAKEIMQVLARNRQP